ncbi:MAG TPA: AI-2E family transporter [Gammaproteobacteria bacterium]|nr:AI-2E family transporter [Gammaproteobacteria bacterium]
MPNQTTINDSQKWWLFAVMLTAGVLVYLLAPVLTPFLAGALLAYLGDPLVDRMEDRGLPRTLAVVVIFLLLFLLLAGLILLLVPALQQQLVSLVRALPRYLDWMQANLAPWLHQTFGIDPAALDWSALKSALQKNWSQVGGAAGGIVHWLSSSGMALMALLANLVLIPVVTFYLLRDWDHLVARVRELLPRKWEPTVVQLAREADTVLGAFLRGQLLVMLALATIYSLGLWWVGLELALIIGVVAGLVSFVPYLGFIIGIVLAGIAAYMQFHEAYYLLLVAAVFGVGQALEGMLLTPLLVGDKIGLHPVAVIFAVMAGGQLFGFVGVMLALPAAAVIMVLLRYVHQRYQQSELYADS